MDRIKWIAASLFQKAKYNNQKAHMRCGPFSVVTLHQAFRRESDVFSDGLALCQTICIQSHK